MNCKGSSNENGLGNGAIEIVSFTPFTSKINRKFSPSRCFYPLGLTIHLVHQVCKLQSPYGKCIPHFQSFHAMKSEQNVSAHSLFITYAAATLCVI